MSLNSSTGAREVRSTTRKGKQEDKPMSNLKVKVTKAGGSCGNDDQVKDYQNVLDRLQEIKKLCKLALEKIESSKQRGQVK